ncbi:ArnT family glycosyltransferase [Poriferisphaera sp. WC338]|uniref:ArnT family glycosyltransferase n=1 Tax=Poriferisphaera sp. WC338 TaxID=3425129 RepID=UPI003D813140
MDESPREQFLERIPFLLVFYFILACLFRLASSPTLEMDEAEQVIMTQLPFRWTYASQPPLYTWLQKLIFDLLSPSVFSLIALKLALLASTFLLAYSTVKRISDSTLTATIAALSLFLIPQYLWESQRDLTHSVLVTTITALTVYLLIRIYQKQWPIDYLLLGLAFSAGLLSKYNYVFPLLAFLFAALSIPSFRRQLFNKKFFLTLIPFLIILGFQIYAIMQHQKEVAKGVSDFNIQTIGLPALGKGLLSLLTNSLAFLAPLLIVAVICVIGSNPADDLEENEAAYDEEYEYEEEEEEEEDSQLTESQIVTRTLKRFLAISIIYIILIAAILFAITGGTSLKDRWLQPLYYIIPLYLALLITPKLSNHRQNLFMTISGIAAVVVLILLPLQPILSPIIGKPSRRNDPFPKIATKLITQKLDLPQIIAADRRIAGNLKLALPHAQVISPNLPHNPINPALPTLLVWDIDRSQNLPAPLDEIAHQDFALQLPLKPQLTLTATKYYTPTTHERANLTLGIDIINHPAPSPKAISAPVE